MTAPGSSGLAQRLAADTLHAATGRVAGLLLWLVLTPPLYRALGTDGFAVWSLYYALTGYLGALDFGLAGATLRHVAASRARADHESAGAFATVSLLGYVALGALWLGVVPALRGPIFDFLHVPASVRGAADFAFLMGAVTFALSGVGATIVSVLQAYGRFDLGNRTTLTVTLAQAAGLALCLWRGWGLPGVVSVTAASWLVAIVVGLFALRSGAPGFRWASPARASRELGESARFGAPLQLANVLAVAHQQLDKVLLARFVALGVVAPYELGLRMATSAATVPQLLMLALVPAAAGLHAAGDAARLEQLHARSNRYVVFAAVTVTAGVVAGAARLLTAWLGAPDADATLALRGLMLAAFAGLTSGMASVTARGIGRTDLEAEFSGVALAAHLALGLWLVPAHGLAGALIALLAGNVLGSAWFLARLAQAQRWPLVHVLVAPLAVPLPSLAAGVAAAWALDRALPASSGLAAWGAALATGGCAVLVCAALALLLRYVKWDELLHLARLRAMQPEGRA